MPQHRQDGIAEHDGASTGDTPCPGGAGTDVASRAPRQTMQALLQDKYGSPDVLRIAHIPKPVPEPGQVVVRVQASSVNARDWHLMRGGPKLAHGDIGMIGPAASEWVIAAADERAAMLHPAYPHEFVAAVRVTNRVTES